MLNYDGYLYFKADRYECLKDPKGLFYVKELDSGKFFTTLSVKVDESYCLKIRKSFWDYFAIAYGCLSIFSAVVFTVFYFSDFGRTNYDLSIHDALASLVLLLVNVVIHEVSHALFLMMFGQKVSKVGFKMNFIFPTVFVNTSNVYLLPRTRRFFVFAAGIETNLIFVGAFSFLFPNNVALVLPIFWAALVSLLPLGAIRTDGYNMIFNAIMKKDEHKGEQSTTLKVSKILFIIIVSIMIFLSILRLVDINL